jgi:hypothetical protein
MEIPGGASGLFVFDPGTEKWTYTYVDGYGRVYDGDVRFAKRQVTVTGTLRYADGTEVLRKIEVRASSGLIDYVVTDSRDNGQTWDDEDRRRLTSLTDTGRPSF